MSRQRSRPIFFQEPISFRAEIWQEEEEEEEAAKEAGKRKRESAHKKSLKQVELK